MAKDTDRLIFLMEEISILERLPSIVHKIKSIKYVLIFSYPGKKLTKISNLKNVNIFLSSLIFLIVTIVWVLLLGFGSPVALIGGFIFDKWIGTFVVSFSFISFLFIRDVGAMWSNGPKYEK